MICETRGISASGTLSIRPAQWSRNENRREFVTGGYESRLRVRAFSFVYMPMFTFTLLLLTTLLIIRLDQENRRLGVRPI